MESLEYRLDFYVNKTLDAYLEAAKEQSKPALPVDLEALARESGIIDIEIREMIPEAAVQLEGDRFKIYLQKNFLNRPGTRRRQRFSLAHEIAHTFFFELQDGLLKPVKGGPRGLQLEKACHQGGSMLLIPERFLERELKKIDNRVHAQEILQWAKTFDVSVEVLLRRLQNNAALDSDDVSFALVSNGRIKFVNYPPWLMSILPAPTLDIAFEEWLSPAGASLQTLEGNSYRVTNGEVALSARASKLTAAWSLFEIRITDRDANGQLKFSV
jgi:Zn-dependent peptidase ImmA (M78 family)